MPCLQEPKDRVGGKDQGRVGAARDEKPNLASCLGGWKQGAEEVSSRRPHTGFTREREGQEPRGEVQAQQSFLPRNEQDLEC